MSSEHDKTLEQREEERLMRAINHKKVSMNFPKPKVEQQAPKQIATPSNTSGLTWSQVHSFCLPFYEYKPNLNKISCSAFLITCTH